MDEDEIERLLAYLGDRCEEAQREEAERLLATVEDALPIEPADGQCVLYGFEGTVDASFRVPEPLPEVLLRPLMERLTLAVDNPMECRMLRVAEYRRIGEWTYERAR